MILRGRTIFSGVACGEALVTTMGISFFGGVDPETGAIVERGHELEGQNIAGKVLVFPRGKGSTVGSYTLYRLKQSGRAPAAIINIECETITAVGCIIAEIPCLDHIPIEKIQSGQRLVIDGESASVKIIENAPLLPMPEPLRGLDGSFTHHTITSRLPDIGRRTLAEGCWSKDIANRLQALINDMPQGTLRPLDDSEAPDIEDWNRDIAPYLGQTWLEAPWFVAETYFFRRILEATGYYRSAEGQGIDPYATQKLRGLASIQMGMNHLRHQLEIGRTIPTAESRQFQTALASLLRACMWSNMSDLSMWPVEKLNIYTSSSSKRKVLNLVQDQALLASRYITGKMQNPTTQTHIKPFSPIKADKRVDFLLDNSGFELACVMVLADFLLSTNLAQRVVFHCKSHPTYVSDATTQDVHELVNFLETIAEPSLKELARRVKAYLTTGMISLQSNYFWTSPRSGWQMPADLFCELCKSRLIINMGDANYRRWLGDRHWHSEAPLKGILTSLPATWLALRVLKAEVIAGLPPGKAAQCQKKDAQWMFNGKWGLIQWVHF